MQGTHEKPDPHLLTLHIIVLIIGSRAVTTLATPFRRVAEAHHARRSCEASLETPPLFHLRIHRRRGKIHRRASGRRADRLRGRALVARAPRGEDPKYVSDVKVRHRVHVAAQRDVLVRQQKRHGDAGARRSSGCPWCRAHRARPPGARASVGMDGRWNVDANANRDLHDPSFDDVSMRSPW